MFSVLRSTLICVIKNDIVSRLLGFFREVNKLLPKLEMKAFYNGLFHLGYPRGANVGYDSPKIYAW